MARTLLGALLNKTPIPLAPRTSGRGMLGTFASPRGQEAQLRAMSATGTLFSIVNVTSNAVARVDWKLWRKARSGLKEDRIEVTSHAALDLWNKPNPFMPRQEFVETFQQHVDLTGEGWWVIARNPRAKLPLELWPARPDRMEPIPHPEEFLTGYIYRGPSGEQVPLERDAVIQLRVPNPMDPYRGMSPVLSVLPDLDTTRYAAEWIRAFFLNSAEPGGIVELPSHLGDGEWNEMLTRWDEQHRGVANSHRVAFLEHGQWKDRKYTQKDMQFVELRGATRDAIREAYGIPKFALGDVEDVNRASALASKAWFAEQLTIPRLERIKAALNHDLLPLYGATSVGLEFDYCDPVPADPEAVVADRDSRVTAAVKLIDAGLDPVAVLDALDLPDMAVKQGEIPLNKLTEMIQDIYLGVDTVITWEEAREILNRAGANLDLGVPPPAKPAPAVSPPPSGPPALEPADPAPVPEARALTMFDRAAARLLRNADDDALDQVREDHAAAMADLDEAWEPIEAAWIDALGDQIEAAVDNDDTEALAGLAVDSERAAGVLRGALAATAQQAADRMAGEAAGQGVTVTVPDVAEALTARLTPGRIVAFGDELVAIAATVAALLASGMAASAAQEAVRRYMPGVSGTEVASAVKGFLRDLKGRFRRDQLGGAVHRAQNVGRIAVLEAAPAARYVATEKNDSNRCGPCSDIDGTEWTNLADAIAAYGAGPYHACEGGIRCRGTVTAVWDTTEDRA